MTKKEVKNVAKQSIFDGKTKQETFDDLERTSELSPEKLAKIIQKIPTIQARKKYKVLNIILIVLLSLTVLFKMMAGIPIIVANGIKWIPILFLLPIINVLLLIGVATYSPNSHKLVALFTFLGVLQYVGNIFGEPFNPLILIDLAIFAGLIILGLYLNYNLCPDYSSNEECYQDSRGEYHLRTVIKFDD